MVLKRITFLSSVFLPILFMARQSSAATVMTDPEVEAEVDTLLRNAPTAAWAQPPGSHHRLYLDVYNVTDFYDYETLGVPQVHDRTILADTVRPTATILWDDRFRIELGATAEKSYGAVPEIIAVDPWLQLLWQPTRPLSVIFGDLNTPHYYLPAIFYETNYVQQFGVPTTVDPRIVANDINNPSSRTHETGAQVLLRKPHWFDDWYFNYFGVDTPSHNEQFDWGLIHQNEFWRHLRLNYQFHWRHEGGESNPHPINVINDVAQAVGGTAFYDVRPGLRLGGNIWYLHSHYRIDATDVTKDIKQNGNAQMYEAYMRYYHLKLRYSYWRGNDFFTKDGNPIYTLPRLVVLGLRWDIVASPDFNLLAETSGYFVGNNDRGVDRRFKPVFHIQATWQFSLPVMEWTSPAASPEGPPIPPRWDFGI